MCYCITIASRTTFDFVQTETLGVIPAYNIVMVAEKVLKNKSKVVEKSKVDSFEYKERDH